MHSHGLRLGAEKGSRGGGEIRLSQAGVQFARQERIMWKAHGVQTGSISSADGGVTGWVSGQC